MKKTYLTPHIEEITIELEGTILLSSGDDDDFSADLDDFINGGDAF